MARMQVGLRNGPSGVPRDAAWILLQRPPEIAQVAIAIVDGFNARLVLARQQDGQAAGERLDIVPDVAQARPDQIGRARLAAEPRERGLHGSPRCLRPRSIMAQPSDIKIANGM